MNDFLDNLAAEQYQKMHKKDNKRSNKEKPVDDFCKTSDDKTK